MNRELKILTPFGTSTVSINLKTPFSSKPFISLRRDSINNGEVYLEAMILGFVRLLLININISTIFYQNLISDHYIHFNFQRDILAASSLVNSLVGSSVGSSVSSLVGSSSSSLLGFSSSGYRYSFTAIVLKSVGLLGSYILYIFPSIPSNLNKLVYLPLYLVLPLRYTSTSKLKRRLQIIVIDRPFCQFNISLTYFFALILIISSITFFIATARYIIEGTSRSSSLIRGQALKTSSIRTKPSRLAVLLAAFTTIYRANSLVIPKSYSFSIIIQYTQRRVR